MWGWLPTSVWWLVGKFPQVWGWLVGKFLWNTFLVCGFLLEFFCDIFSCKISGEKYNFYHEDCQHGFIHQSIIFSVLISVNWFSVPNFHQLFLNLDMMTLFKVLSHEPWFVISFKMMPTVNLSTPLVYPVILIIIIFFLFMDKDRIIMVFNFFFAPCTHRLPATILSAFASGWPTYGENPLAFSLARPQVKLLWGAWGGHPHIAQWRINHTLTPTKFVLQSTPHRNFLETSFLDR